MTLPTQDEFYDYLIEVATPEKIIAYKSSDEAQKRADYLAERKSEGMLTAPEADELEQMLELDRFVSLLKAKALAMLKQEQV